MADATPEQLAALARMRARAEGRSVCGNVDCINGWIPVTDEYAVELAGGDPLKFAALRNTVVSCPEDAPDRYRRWLEGHYVPNHGPGCPECDPRAKAKKAS